MAETIVHLLDAGLGMTVCCRKLVTDPSLEKDASTIRASNVTCPWYGASTVLAGGSDICTPKGVEVTVLPLPEHEQPQVISEGWRWAIVDVLDGAEVMAMDSWSHHDPEERIRQAFEHYPRYARLERTRVVKYERETIALVNEPDWDDGAKAEGPSGTVHAQKVQRDRGPGELHLEDPDVAKAAGEALPALFMAGLLGDEQALGMAAQIVLEPFADSLSQSIERLVSAEQRHQRRTR